MTAACAWTIGGTVRMSTNPRTENCAKLATMNKAMKIEYRAKNGFYDSVDSLQKLPGFTPELVAKIRPEIALKGDAYVPTKVAVKEKEKEKKGR